MGESSREEIKKHNKQTNPNKTSKTLDAQKWLFNYDGFVFFFVSPFTTQIRLM